jgi:hypothetical protein
VGRGGRAFYYDVLRLPDGPFFEYFHGDHGEGLGARAQTGWSALVGTLLHPRTPPVEGLIAPPTLEAGAGGTTTAS